VALYFLLFGGLSIGIALAFRFHRDAMERAGSERELQLARRIQQSFLLSEFPPASRLEVYAVNVSSREVSGDFYDVVAIPGGGYLLAIADVSGKGVPAALLSSMLQASLRTQAGNVSGLGDILRNINSLLYHSTEIQQFATFFLARIECPSGRLAFSNAGHNWPVVLRQGAAPVFLEQGGTLLGILEGAQYEEGVVKLAPGDRVILYTDGISEAMNAEGEQFGEERLVALVCDLPKDLSAREVAERIMEALREFLGPVEPQDDMTLLVLRAFETSQVPAGEAPTREAVIAN
jgi:sigma-B regulation protein RsbU (phosphoserine phosphatase)